MRRPSWPGPGNSPGDDTCKITTGVPGFCTSSTVFIGRRPPGLAAFSHFRAVTVPEERLAFSLALLADAKNAPRPIAGCERGHLVVAGRTHWAAEAFSADLRTLTCVHVPDCDG